MDEHILTATAIQYASEPNPDTKKRCRMVRAQ
jgi:hypothetical protein